MAKPSFQNKCVLITVALVLLLSAATAVAQVPTSISYQGRLVDSGTPATGSYDIQFALFDSMSGGAQIGATQTVTNVAVSAGVFTVQLDFGATAFPGASRFLEISARLAGAASFTTLAPRQPITSTPYAIRSLNASSADAVTVNGVPGGSGNYIQNSTTQQAGASFNIGGNGTAQSSFTAVQYNTCQAGTGCTNISRVLSTPGTFNVFVGQGTGQDLTSGGGNTFVGNAAGLGTTEGIGNSFFGLGAGRVNTTGDANTIIGWVGELGSSNLTNATAIGARATVAQSNSLVLGSINGINNATSSVNVGIGTTSPQAPLDVAATGDGAGLLRFSTERPWVFRQAYSGPGTALRLQPITGLKNFEITAAVKRTSPRLSATTSTPGWAPARPPQPRGFPLTATYSLVGVASSAVSSSWVKSIVVLVRARSSFVATPLTLLPSAPPPACATRNESLPSAEAWTSFAVCDRLASPGKWTARET